MYSGIAYPKILYVAPSRYRQVQDEGQCFVEFTLGDDRVEAIVVALNGEQIGTWTQPLNKAR